MREICTVKKVKRGCVYIELTRTERCDGCQMCAFNKRKSMTVPARTEISVDAGERVIVEMPTRAVGAGALAIYAIPLLLMVARAHRAYRRAVVTDRALRSRARAWAAVRVYHRQGLQAAKRHTADDSRQGER